MSMQTMSDPIASPDVLAAHLAGEAVLLHMGSKRYYRLNATGAEVWRGLEAGEGVDAIVARLRMLFEVSEAEARAETERFCASLGRAELLARAG